MINIYISYILWIDIQKMGSLHNNKLTICYIFHIYHKGKDVSLNLLGRVLRIILKLLICSSKNYISFFFYILFSNVIINFIKKKRNIIIVLIHNNYHWKIFLTCTCHLYYHDYYICDYNTLPTILYYPTYISYFYDHLTIYEINQFSFLMDSY